MPPGEQAQEYARELLEGKHVRLEFDAEQKDDGYKTLAYVFLVNDNTFVNARILSGDSPTCGSRAPNLNMRGNCATRTGKGARTATGWMNKNTDVILRNVKETVAASGALSCGDTVIVGVSGGPDSVALLHALFVLRHELGLSLHVAHFNHNWRKSAAMDEHFVRRLAGQWGCLARTDACRGGSRGRQQRGKSADARSGCNSFNVWQKRSMPGPLCSATPRTIWWRPF